MGMAFCIIDESGGKEKAYYYVTFAHIKITTFINDLCSCQMQNSLQALDVSKD